MVTFERIIAINEISGYIAFAEKVEFSPVFRAVVSGYILGRMNENDSFLKLPVEEMLTTLKPMIDKVCDEATKTLLAKKAELEK